MGHCRIAARIRPGPGEAQRDATAAPPSATSGEARSAVDACHERAPPRQVPRRPSSVAENSHDSWGSMDAVGSQVKSFPYSAHPGPGFCLISDHSPVDTQRDASAESDCLRAVPRSNAPRFESHYLPASSAPRPRLERGTYCLGGIPVTRPDVAGRGVTCRFAEVIVAGCGLT